MSILIFKSLSRHLAKHPWQLGLALLGIMVGVAVIVAIRLTQHSAFAAFDAATRTTFGLATHRAVGRRGQVGNETLRWLARTFPEIHLTPVVRRPMTLPDYANRNVELLGVEPISRVDVAPAGRPERLSFDPAELIAEPLSAVINEPTANALGLREGSSITVRSGATSARLRIIDVLPPAHAAGGIVNDVIVVDIATAQEVLGVYDGVSQVNLRVDDPLVARELAIKSAGLGPSVNFELIDLAAESRSMKRMTAAFYSNLTALSLMALLVGMFLIYNTETFLVIQRRELFGRLRALGVGRKQILASILLEAAALGFLGSLAGIAFGVWLANGLLGVVSTTINDLYFEASIHTLSIAPFTLALSLAVGVTATLAASLFPAYSAIRLEPNVVIGRSGLRPMSIAWICIVTALAFALCNVAAWIVLSRSQTPNAGFAGICLVVIGFAALCPGAIVALSAGSRRLIGAHRLLPERLGFGTVSVTLNRTGTATAALMIATAASIGIGIMVTSFRGSVADWLDSVLRADLYVADAEFDNYSRDRKIPRAVVDRLERLPEVLATSNVLRGEADSANGRIRLSAFTLNAKAKQGFRFKAGDVQAIWRQWETADVAIITEPYAYHHGISVGDDLNITTPRRNKLFKIVGIYLDYASERGSVSISRASYDRYWDTKGYDGIGIYGAPAVTIEDLRSAVTGSFGTETSLLVNSTAQLKETSLAVFDRTFLITELLRAIAVIVSFIGVLGALLAQQLERTREYGILRAIGFSNLEMSRTILTQTALLGATAALIAIPVGILIGVILIEVINPRSFGWTMTMQIPLGLLFESCSIALLAALCAGLHPSYRAARIEPADALRYE